MPIDALPAAIEALFDEKPPAYAEDHFRLFQEFKNALNAGAIRAAEPDAATSTGWRVNAWVKKGILLGFRLGGIVDMSIDRSRQPFFDKATYPLKTFSPASGVRIVPGGHHEGETGKTGFCSCGFSHPWSFTPIDRASLGRDSSFHREGLAGC